MTAEVMAKAVTAHKPGLRWTALATGHARADQGRPVGSADDRKIDRDYLNDPPPFLRAHVSSDGTFEPVSDHTGESLAVVPVRNHRAKTFDLVAWRARNPREWWTLRGLAVLLGEWSLCRAQWTGEAVRLVGTPADWLKEPSQSICILDWRVCLRSLLSDLAAVVPADDEIDRLLRAQLADQIRPSFEIRGATA